jgi:hypothetical protein
MATEEAEKKEEGRHVWRRAERIEQLYVQMVNRLWLAHGAAIGITLTIISNHGERKYKLLFWPLLMFVAGLALLAAGDVALMIKDARAVKRLQSKYSILDLLISDVL